MALTTLPLDRVTSTIPISKGKWTLLSDKSSTHTLRVFGSGDGGVIWLGFSKSSATAPVGVGVPFRESVMLATAQNELCVWGVATNSTQTSIAVNVV